MKSFHGRARSCCPKSGYAVGGLSLLAVPLEKRKRTDMSSGAGKGVGGAVVKSSNVRVEA